MLHRRSPWHRRGQGLDPGRGPRVLRRRIPGRRAPPVGLPRATLERTWRSLGLIRPSFQLTMLLYEEGPRRQGRVSRLVVELAAGGSGAGGLLSGSSSAHLSMAFCEKDKVWWEAAPAAQFHRCLLYTSPSPRD